MKASGKVGEANGKLLRSRKVYYVFALVAVTTLVFLVQSPSPSRWSRQNALYLQAKLVKRDARELRLMNRTLNAWLSSTQSERNPRLWPEFPLTAEQCRNATFVTATNRGRLGNTIGEYASVFAYGLEYGKIPVLSGTLLESLLLLFPHLNLRRVNETGCQERNWTEMGLPNKD
ncbi:unnamed protein product [Darwinula stevensoni]|uniref:Uncharacterized protein n=1 Tax=Darwinula stevensoni TaxID=69355 RepID=A0A7R8XLX9_9CRUS|nr:unnamed protein product [Darwinula stevensoni]CAG0894845.1 unnamed protein product [Darwinula stevensoni]